MPIAAELISDEDTRRRQELMHCCAMASAAELAAAAEACAPLPEIVDIRRPETGLVMLRGRVGGEGGPFNVGEATVTRAVVSLATGEVGHAYLLGRSFEDARLAALIDALGQSPERRRHLEAVFVAPVKARLADERAAKDAETAATRVNFFTLIRGED